MSEANDARNARAAEQRAAAQAERAARREAEAERRSSSNSSRSSNNNNSLGGFGSFLGVRGNFDITEITRISNNITRANQATSRAAASTVHWGDQYTVQAERYNMSSDRARASAVNAEVALNQSHVRLNNSQTALDRSNAERSGFEDGMRQAPMGRFPQAGQGQVAGAGYAGYAQGAPAAQQAGGVEQAAQQLVAGAHSRRNDAVIRAYAETLDNMRGPDGSITIERDIAFGQPGRGQQARQLPAGTYTPETLTRALGVALDLPSPYMREVMPTVLSLAPPAAIMPQAARAAADAGRPVAATAAAPATAEAAPAAGSPAVAAPAAISNLVAANGELARNFGAGVGMPAIAANQVEAVQAQIAAAFGSEHIRTSRSATGVDGKWGAKTQTAFLNACEAAGVNPATVDFTKPDNAASIQLQEYLSRTATGRAASPEAAPAPQAAPAEVAAQPAAAHAADVAAVVRSQVAGFDGLVAENVTDANRVNNVSLQLSNLGFATDTPQATTQSIKTVETGLGIQADGIVDTKLIAALNNREVQDALKGLAGVRSEVSAQPQAAGEPPAPSATPAQPQRASTMGPSV